MSWLFSRALVEAYSEANCSAGAPSAPSSTSPMPQAYLSPDRMTAFCRLSRFGMTFEPLTDGLGAAVSTWCLAAFPARTSAPPEKAPGSPASAAGYGWKWCESSVKYDPAMCSWKTRQCSLFEDSEWFSETWPRWGLMRDGECWELPMSARQYNALGSGSLPGPTRSMAKKGFGFSINGPSKRYGQEIQRNIRELIAEFGWKPAPEALEWSMGWPIGWTGLRPLETDKCHNAPPRRGAS